MCSEGESADVDLLERQEPREKVPGLSEGEGVRHIDRIYLISNHISSRSKLISRLIFGLQSFGCGFFQWVDEETSPFLTQLRLDLRNAVWSLEAHNRILDRNVHGWQSPNLEHIEATASTWIQTSDVLADEDNEYHSLRLSISRLKQQRRLLGLLLLVCIVIGSSVFMRLGE